MCDAAQNLLKNSADGLHLEMCILCL